MDNNHENQGRLACLKISAWESPSIDVHRCKRCECIAWYVRNAR